MQIAGWLLGLVRGDGVWHHAKDACCASWRRRHVKTHFRNQSASEGGQLSSCAYFTPLLLYQSLWDLAFSHESLLSLLFLLLQISVVWLSELFCMTFALILSTLCCSGRYPNKYRLWHLCFKSSSLFRNQTSYLSVSVIHKMLFSRTGWVLGSGWPNFSMFIIFMV